MTGQLKIPQVRGLATSFAMLLVATATLGFTGSNVRADTLYVSTEFRDVDKITSAGAVTVFASLPSTGVYPDGLAFDSSGNLYTTDPNKRQIDKITPSGTVSLFKTLAASSFPAGLAIDGSGNLYVQTPNNDISKITPAGTLSYFATLPTGAEAGGLVFDSGGNLYVADGNHDVIDKITPAGTVSLFATLPTNTLPEGLAFDSIGNLYEAGFDNKVHKITAGGAVSLFATLPISSDPEAIGLAFDSSGNLYAAGLSGEISKITATGAVSHFATATNAALFIAVTDDAGHPLAVPPATLYGDYNRNGVVDAADYVILRKGLSTTFTQDDYNVWRANFGQMTVAGVAGTSLSGFSVPEPSGIGLLLAFVSLCFMFRKGRRSECGLLFFARQCKLLTRTLRFAALLCAAAASSCYAITYTTLDYPGSVNTYAFGISGNNIVGSYDSGSVGDTTSHGFLYNGSTYTPLDDPLATMGTSANAIDGENIVGNYQDAVGNHGFLFDGINYTTLGDVPSAPQGSTAYFGISGNNMVGQYGYFDSAGNGHGFLYNGNTYTTLDAPLGVHGTSAAAISGGNIVGFYITLTKYDGFLCNGTTYTTLEEPLATQGTQASGIDGGNIVGNYQDAVGNHGFLYDGSTYTTINDPLGTFGSLANGISGNKVVGYFIDSSGKSHGFLATVPEPGDFNDNGIVDAADYVAWRNGLGATFTPSDYNVWRAHFGQTLGGSSGATGSASAGSTVPESSSLFLLLAAANAGLMYRARPFRLWRTLCEHDGAIAEASTF